MTARLRPLARGAAGSSGVALIMVVIVLSTLAIIGAPFVISMGLQDRASHHFAGEVAARQAAEAARNHAIAGLQDTVYGVEYRDEAETLAAERPVRSYKDQGKVRKKSSRRGMVVRKDRNEKAPAKASRAKSMTRGGRNRQGDDGDRPDLPEGMVKSKKGTSPREVDGPGELEAPLLGQIALPAAARIPIGLTDSQGTFSFQDPSGLSSSATVTDEQGKININTAPPVLLANLFGVSQLARPLHQRETDLVLDDATMFRGDADPATIDGAVIIVDAEQGYTEAITYRRKDGDALRDGFRGAYLSLILDHVYPVGTFVYDLRGVKAAYHRLWAAREGGFHPRELTRFAAVEGLREIAGWQMASFFVSRFRGEGLTPEFLRECGINPKKLAELGLDPYIGSGVEGREAPDADAGYEAARKDLRKLGVKSDLVEKLKKARGAQVVIDLASRLQGMGKKEVDGVEKDLEKSLASDSRRAAKIPRDYLKAALEALAEAYEAKGLETVLPEDLERLRDSITVSSTLPAEWSEAQTFTDDVPLTARSGPVPRPFDFNPGTVIRLRSASDPGAVEYSVAGSTGKTPGTGGISFAFPLRASIKGYDGLVQALQRHPVNINSASKEVLRAVLTGIRGYAEKQVMTPFKADRLAAYLLGSRPIADHRQLHDLLEEAVKARIIDGADLEPIMINAVAPTHSFLRVSTTGFVYSSGDVYTIESRGILRAPSGGQVASCHLREIVEVSPARPLALGLITQADMADGFYFTKSLHREFPERRHPGLLQYPGTRSHLVITRPLLIHRERYAVPGGDLSTLRLFPGETQPTLEEYTVQGGAAGAGEALQGIFHFQDTYEGLELAHGEPWALSIDADPPPAQPTAAPAAAAQVQKLDLTMTPGGIEFWFRMRTYPDTRDEDGHLVLLDAGAEQNRNRISLLYADQLGEVRLRIRDSSIPDPSVLKTRDTGQYLEVVAKRPLELETWYHLRLVWDGVFGGGAQLFIDGIPTGTDNLSTELVTAIPAGGQIAAINVKDASKFPREGVVRIDSELFEYTRSGNTLTLRKEPPSAWVPIPHQGRGRNGRFEEPPPPEEGGQGRGRGGGGGGGVAPEAPPPLEQQAPPGPTGVTAIPGSELMRSPWNKRGYSASEHKAGAKVYVHGYSLEMRRKLRLLNANGNEVERQANGNDIVWGRGGLRAFEPLNAFNFPTGVAGIGHLDIDPSMLGGAANAQYLVPIFDVMETVNEGVMLPGELSPVLPGVAPERNAADYFQSRGVCVLQGRAYLYRKEPLPPAYAQVQAMFRQALPRPQTIGLKILGSYAGGRSQPGLQGWEEWRREAHGNWPWPVFLFDLTQRSLMTSGVIGNLYPPTGILEVRGSPTPWEAYRPNFMGQPMLGRHPDDCVEWIRYAEIFDGVMGGEPLHLFVGRTGSNFNFRGYPEREIQGRPDLRKQLDHPANEPLRLVMELAEGGAGYGDYVTIATSNPAVYERVPRRIFKVLEHEDGRFFASLLDVSSTGVDIPTSPSVFQNTYTRVMNPRLVKFPTWGLSEVYAGSAVLFGDARSGGAASGRQNVGGVREDEDEDPTGITVDEVRRFQNKTMFHNPTLGPRVRFVVVPLDGGAVKQVSTPDGGIALSGEILAGRDISRASPLEVLVVSVSKEETPSIFARGPLKVETEGVLRIGDELFYFEDPYATGDGASPPPGVGTLAGDVNAVAGDDSRVRDPRDRNRLWPENIPGGGLSGHWEREGFARLYDRVAVRFGWSEVFYYKSMGGGFSGCLRGQFGTPISQRVVAATFHNVSRRLRLVGRGLLGTERRTHGYGAPAAHVPYLAMSPITGPLTDEGLAVKSPRFFGKPHGYALLDAAQPNAPWEIIAHLGPAGERLLAVPRDEKGKAMFRACYGTQLRPISNQMFAYELPFRHPDRYEPEREGEGLAYLQKSYRMPGAYWRALEWLERPSRTLRERKPDIVIAARFDGAPEWDAKPTNEPGGLYLFEKADGDEGEPKRFELDRIADQLEIRVYFRYPSGAFTRLPLNRLTDDWKETGILEWLNIEYEKAGVITRHEDLPF